jgi:glycogen debranching enzyme
VQAKWYYALKLLARIDPSEPQRWADLAAQVSANVQQLYVRQQQPWLSDCLHAHPGQSAMEAVADDHFRPNQLLAVTLGLITDSARQRQIVQACTELAVPGALRTLADREVSYPLIVERHGHRLNNPYHPFWPHYTGDEDTRRKPAHNGTAWPWLMPMLAEAIALAYGNTGRPAGLSLLGTAQKLFAAAALGNIAEILDAAHPHAPKGCAAQAWSVSELVRVLAKFDATADAEGGALG